MDSGFPESDGHEEGVDVRQDPIPEFEFTYSKDGGFRNEGLCTDTGSLRGL